MSKPIASLTELRARLSILPRDMQRIVRLLWAQGRHAEAVALVERETTDA